MLFSDSRVSSFIRSHFVAAWESVRPVPIVEIDFGNGRKIKRTVNGNIATYVCTPDGRVIDIIPGLNTPEAFLEDLQAALALWRASLASFEQTVIAHHAAALRTPELIARKRPGLDVRKDEIEAPIKKLSKEEDVVLAADTEINRRERKPLIHRILSERVYRPAELTKRVYKDVLHCDLDDPYLGLISGAFNGGAYESR